jgi:hypothetical protein
MLIGTVLANLSGFFHNCSPRCIVAGIAPPFSALVAFCSHSDGETFRDY